MSEANISDDDVYRFILANIDTVPQIETLLLLWETRPQTWSANELADRLYVAGDALTTATESLVERRLISATAERPPRYYYESAEQKDRLIGAVAATYRRELVKVSTLIHSKEPSAARAFARAFRFTKEQD
jgi:hypothetical protein